jgi:AraC-like DNA-binding protein
LHISTNYLNRLCREYRGVTGGEIIRERVIIEAQRLLQYTTLSVAETAYKLGFESPSYFITFFKKNTGTTPEGFRTMNG